MKNDILEKQIARARAGDGTAAQWLVEVLWIDICTFARRLGASAVDAEDVAQESILKVIRSLGMYNSGTSFRNWALKIAANCVLDGRRSAGLRKEVPVDEHGGQLLARATTADELEIEELQEAIGKATLTLPTLERAIFVMRVHRDLTYEEIAEIVGKPAPTVRWYLHKARAKMLKQLDAYL